MTSIDASQYHGHVGVKIVITATDDVGVTSVPGRGTTFTATIPAIFVPGSEDVEVHLEEMTGAYKRSKFQAEQVALEFAGAGFPVVIVNPTAPIGDHDFKPTPTGKIVVDYLKGAMPAFVAFLAWRVLYQPIGGGINLVLTDTGLYPEIVDWLGGKSTAMPAEEKVSASPRAGFSAVRDLRRPLGAGAPA